MARGYYFNYVQQGGNAVTTDGFVSLTKVQRSFPGATVSVYLAGTSNLATLYSTASGTAKANPFTAGTDASFSFWTDATSFDITFSGTGITTGCGAVGQLACIAAFTWSNQTPGPASSQLGYFNVFDSAATGAQRAVVGNGVSKPLSSYYSTLAAAQVDYPAATALTNELDWAVLQKCTTAAADTNVVLSVGTSSISTCASVLIPYGRYVINQAIQVNLSSASLGGSFVNFIGVGKPIIKQTDATKRIFFWQSGLSGNIHNTFDGIRFGGGARQIEGWNGSAGPAMLRFMNCEFYDSGDYAIHLALEDNTFLTVEDCVFQHCAKLLYNQTHQCRLKDIFMVGDTSVSPADAAFIYNLGVTLVIDGFNGSPQADCTLKTRWIDNYGQKLQIKNSRFGGEGPTIGIGVVWHYAAVDASNGFASPTSVIIEGCELSCGSTNAHSGVVNLRTTVPQLLTIRDCAFLSHAAIVADEDFPSSYATYFSSFGGAAYPVRYTWKHQIEPNIKYEDEIQVETLSYPDALRPFTLGMSGSGRMFHTSGAPAKSFTEGTDSTPVNTEFYFAEVYADADTFVTGVSVLNGSAVSGNMKVGLFDAVGNLLITSGSTAQVGANAYQRVPFATGVGSGGYTLQVSGRYYIGVFVDNSTARIRTHTAGDFGADKKTAQVYATGFTSITPPTAFVAGLGPIASLY